MRAFNVDVPVESLEPDGVVVSVTREELAFLSNVIGEAFEALEDWEFETRVGMPPDGARALREDLARILRIGA